MNRITGRVVDRRADFCAYTANHITARNAVVVLEDLRTRNMTARPGRWSGRIATSGRRPG